MSVSTIQGVSDPLADTDAVAGDEGVTREVQASLMRRLRNLEARETCWIDLAADGPPQGN